MSTDKRYWIWLQLSLGCGAYFKDIIKDFGSVENLYNAHIMEWKMSTALVARQVEALQRHTLNDAEEIIYNCDKNGWEIVTFDDEKYPNRLRDIPNPPAVLYVDGTLPDIENYAAIAVVGTRKASTYASKAARFMSKGAALCGALIISGGALGVDSCAHRGALEAGGKTVAVLGNGLGSDYLQQNKELRGLIKKNGALVTEYPPFTPASKHTFPMRNRIISGLSLGVMVVEAGVKSGSLITAKYAYEQGRDIFAIPASIFDYNFYGTNKLIDDGAIVATNPGVLVSQYAERFASLDLSKLKTVRELVTDMTDKSANAEQSPQIEFDKIARDRAENVSRQNKALQLSGDEKSVYSSLSENLENIDTIIEKSGIDSQKVLVALTMLEMKGLIESASGKRYKLK